MFPNIKLGNICIEIDYENVNLSESKIKIR